MNSNAKVASGLLSVDLIYNTAPVLGYISAN